MSQTYAGKRDNAPRQNSAKARLSITCTHYVHPSVQHHQDRTKKGDLLIRHPFPTFLPCLSPFFREVFVLPCLVNQAGYLLAGAGR